MFGKVLPAAVLAVVYGAAPALADLAGPAELPSPSYQGPQYVDSRGCVFLRAGYGGEVAWVPRLTRDRKQLCGYEPTGGAAEAAAPEPVAKPAPKAVAAPEVKAPKATAKAAAKKPAPAPKAVAKPAPKAATGGAAEGSAEYPLVKPPPGYKLAWKDGRLNPNRGKQTVEGFLAMDEIWTRTTPAELREESAIKRSPVTIIVRHSDGSTSKVKGYVLSSKGGEKLVQVEDSGEILTVKSTKSGTPEGGTAKAAEPVAAGRFLVQVGTYGAASNADGAADRLKGQGLPVARGKLKGGALIVVYAGPFASAAEAKQALSAARGLGFSDARIVR